MGFSILIYLLLLLDYGLAKPIEEVEPEDHLNRPDVDFNEGGYDEITYSFNDHNNDNDHITFASINLDLDFEHKTLSDMDILHLDDQLTTENEVFEDSESSDERTTSRMLSVLSRGLLKIIPKAEPDLDYEIEDRIVRYAMNNMREEI